MCTRGIEEQTLSSSACCVALCLQPVGVFSLLIAITVGEVSVSQGPNRKGKLGIKRIQVLEVLHVLATPAQFLDEEENVLVVLPGESCSSGPHHEKEALVGHKFARSLHHF